MQRPMLFKLLIAALLISSALAEEEWSWGSANGKPSSSSSSGRTRTARKQSSGRVVFEDDGVDVKPRNPRVDLSLRVDNAPHFKISTKSHAPTYTSFVQSTQPVDTPSPVPHYSVPNVVSSSPDSDETFIPVYPPLTQHDIAVNTHGFSAVEHTPPTVVPTAGDRTGRKLVGTHGKADSQGRFLDIDKKLCKMGIGWNCKKGGGRPYSVVNLDEVPYLPTPIHPPQYPVAHHTPAVPYAGSVVNHAPAAVPYAGSAVNHADVFHVQPVALQPVGTPIQAIPLGPAGGKVPYSTPDVHSVGSYGPPVRDVHIGSLGGSVGPLTPVGPISPIAQVGSVGPSIHHLGSARPALPPTYETPSYNPYDVKQDSFAHDVPVKHADDKTVVQHIHQHTHIYEGGKPAHHDSGYIGSITRPSRGDKHFSGHNSLFYSAGYREACECVESYECHSSDIIGREGNLPLLDARTPRLDARTKKDVKIFSTDSKDKSDDNSKVEEKKKEDKKNSRTKRQASALKRPVNPLASAESRRFNTGYTPGASGCRRGHVCCRNPGRSDSGYTSFRCGKRNPSGVVGRVKTPFYEPGNTDFGEYPWQAAILKRDRSDMVYVCGASLIDDRHVMTAAHCVNKVKAYDLQIRLGEWDVHNEDEFYPNVDFDASEIILHPEFYAGMLHNDIAIIRLRNNVDFKRYPHISPVCLPEPYSHFEGKTCYVTGWGKDAFGKDGKFQQILKQVTVPIVGKNRCESALRSTRLGRSFRLHDGMSCAGGEEGKDACKGDGGGPLVCRGSAGEFQLAGVVSWGIGCGERGIPGVYVDVPFYVDWIHEATRRF